MTDLSGLSDAQLTQLYQQSSAPQQSNAPLKITVRPGQSSKPIEQWSDDELKAAYNKPGALEDVGRSIPSGLVRGAAGLVGLPEVIARVGGKGIENAANYVGGKMGLEPYSPGKPMVELPSSEKLIKDYEAEAGPLYKPQTPYGEFAQTASEFVPGALAGPGAGARAVIGNVAKFGIVPGLASEAAGQLTKGTAVEPAARLGGALVGGAAAGMATRSSATARTLRGQLPEGITPEIVDQARGLIDTAAQQGITLTWPEALSQTAGRPVLSNLMRHIEAHPSTEARMAELFGERPQQVENAGRQAMDQLAPVNDAPSTIGPAFGKQAENEVRSVEKARTAAVDPYYQAAATDRVPHPAMQNFIAELDRAIAADKTGIVGSKLGEIRKLLIETPATPAVPAQRVGKQTPNGTIYQTTPGKAGAAEVPLTDIENIDRVRKYVRDQLDMPQIGLDAITKEQGAAIMGSLDKLETLMTKASPNFAAGKQLFQDISERIVNPVMQGPLGKLAKSDVTTEKAINTLFPKSPNANSAKEVGDAVQAVAARSPKAAEDLVRAHAEKTFNEATRDLQSGHNQAGGAKFRAVLVGNSQQRANFEAAVKALPHGSERLDGFNKFLEVVEATGTRQGIGSKTSYNQVFNEQLSNGGIIENAAKAGANPIQMLQPFVESYKLWRAGHNLNQLADILTNPQAVGQLRAISRMPTGSAQALRVSQRLLMLSASSREVQQPGQ